MSKREIIVPFSARMMVGLFLRVEITEEAIAAGDFGDAEIIGADIVGGVSPMDVREALDSDELDQAVRKVVKRQG